MFIALSPQHQLMRLFSATDRFFLKSHRGICTYQANVSNMLNIGRLQTVALGCLINRSSPFDLSFSKVIQKNLLENAYNLKYTLGMLKPAQIKHCICRKYIILQQGYFFINGCRLNLKFLLISFSPKCVAALSQVPLSMHLDQINLFQIKF